MHIGLGPKPFILATSVFNYADAFDGDLSAWDVSVVIYSARLKSIVYIGWLICTVACAHGVFHFILPLVLVAGQYEGGFPCPTWPSRL